MAVWTRFDPAIDLMAVAAKAIQQDLYFSDGQINVPDGIPHATRLGFASSTREELEHCVNILSDLCSR
jgi:DNA-binding transcriptional MocR family regulator